MAVLVRAHALGFWDNTRRRSGDEFLVPDEFAKKSKWWHLASEKPPAERAAAAAAAVPGNANAHHAPGSPGDLRSKRPASSARPAKPEAADGDESEKPAGTGKPKAEKPAGTGDQKVLG